MMGGIEEVSHALRERAPIRRADSEAWREDIPPEDSAPQWAPEQPDVSAWGRSQDEAREMLRRQACPVCGEGPWRSPLTHIAKRHGIPRGEVRETCGLNSVESVVAPEYAERISERERARGRDMQALAARPRRKYRMTTAGSTALTQNLQEWEAANPEDALRVRSEAGRAGAAARWRAERDTPATEDADPCE